MSVFKIGQLPPAYQNQLQKITWTNYDPLAMTVQIILIDKFILFVTAMKRNQLNAIFLVVICSTLLVFAEEGQNFDEDGGVTIESEKIVSATAYRTARLLGSGH